MQASEVVILWDDGKKVPLAESEEYVLWLKQQLSQKGLSPKIHVPSMFPRRRLWIFAWIYHHLERLKDDLDLRNKQACVDASSGTWVMSACWIVFKKAFGLDLQLFRSSPEKGRRIHRFASESHYRDDGGFEGAPITAL